MFTSEVYSILFLMCAKKGSSVLLRTMELSFVVGINKHLSICSHRLEGGAIPEHNVGKTGKTSWMECHSTAGSHTHTHTFMRTHTPFTLICNFWSPISLTCIGVGGHGETKEHKEYSFPVTTENAAAHNISPNRINYVYSCLCASVIQP